MQVSPSLPQLVPPRNAGGGGAGSRHGSRAGVGNHTMCVHVRRWPARDPGLDRSRGAGPHGLMLLCQAAGLLSKEAAVLPQKSMHSLPLCWSDVPGRCTKHHGCGAIRAIKSCMYPHARRRMDTLHPHLRPPCLQRHAAPSRPGPSLGVWAGLAPQACARPACRPGHGLRSG